ncbi:MULTISPECIES: DUF596 domain-containing protein [Photorhabdus]|uniref:DUF596 domain-containing protein n=2 Tax=Photorhabdus TaxID=29487 RepID=A0A329VAE4_9GAMM|nr:MULTISPECIES: DUF596 domain-containing protein [Photorhabdus]MCC8466989.1 DUF596 domain-containing protein [Photorhabdus bodei]NHB62292.1 DUF596 domain-containing protein [Photorhabdus sp. RW14-46]PQQ22126.1 DUF596 domain-containing protein [Photorhabdus hindustanensis]RAW82038.1 DUF596 domain-containing protein [Photorhabdus laumondii subsp. clarkei]
MLFHDDEYKVFRDELEGSSPSTIWGAMCANNLNKINLSFEERKNYFLEFIERLLKENKIKLAKNGVFLEGTTDEQLTHFRVVFPKTEEELYYGLWFTFEECPGGIVWVSDDGSLDWT